jgi:hypothetical protein
MDSVIQVAEKQRLSSASREERGIEGECNEYVRNTNGHWIFAVQGIEISQECKDVALSALTAMGLDFGSVDMLILEDDLCKVLEINSSSGMDKGGSTLKAYTKAFKEYTLCLL